MRRAIGLLALSFLLEPATACKREPGDATAEPRAGRRTARAAKQKLPEPLAIPAQPDLALHAAEPALWLPLLAAWGIEPSSAQGVAERLLVGVVEPKLAATIAAAVVADRPWSLAAIDEEPIVRLPVRREAVVGLARGLSGKRIGDFGAVEVAPPAPPMTTPAAPAPARLLWVDEATATVTVAATLRGVATGPALERAWAKRPLFVTASAPTLVRFGGQRPLVERFTIEGEGPHAFRLTATGLAEEGKQALARTADGALTGLLHDPGLVFGASTRVAGHEDQVKKVLARARGVVADQNFLVRGVLEELLGRAAAVLRAWDGRVAAAIGPRGHVRVAFGVGSAETGERAVLHLVRGVVDNLAMASGFGLPVPELTLKSDAARSGDVRIHRMRLKDAASVLAPEAHALLDGSRQLQIAFASSPHAGATLVVAGPRAVETLQAWLTANRDAAPGRDSTADRMAAVAAVEPAAARELVQSGKASGVLGLQPSPHPTHAVLRQQGDGIAIEFTHTGSVITSRRADARARRRPDSDDGRRASAALDRPGLP